MAFCAKCGTKLEEGAKFCPNCGTAAAGAGNDGSKRVQKFDGEIHKCPNCGAQLPSFAAKCPECGFELRGMKNESALTRLNALLDKVTGEGSDEINRKKVKIMKNFPIPTAAEDMLELMIAASSYIQNAQEGVDWNLYFDWNSQPECNLACGYVSIMEGIKNKMTVITGLKKEQKDALNKLYDDARSSIKQMGKNKGKDAWKTRIKCFLGAAVCIGGIVFVRNVELFFLIKVFIYFVLGLLAIILSGLVLVAGA